MRDRTKNIAPHGHLGKSGETEKLVFTGVRGKLKQDVLINDNENSVVKAGEKVIIQPLNRDKSDQPQKYIITPYKDDPSKTNFYLPESNRDIITDKSYQVEIDKTDEVFSFNSEHYQRYEKDLFPKVESPSIEEIIQARVPDCFFLAAIQSILNHPDGQSFIRGMMRQNDDGTTTVRLYDPETLEPQYIRVENSVMVDSFGELNLHKALWIHILEKAFVARGIKDNTEINASMSSIYSGGGYPYIAMRSLTGIKADRYYVKPDAISKPKIFAWQMEAFMGKKNCESFQYFIDSQGDLAIQKIAQSLENFHDHLNGIYELFDLPHSGMSREDARLNYAELIKCYLTDREAYYEALINQSVEKVKNIFSEKAVNILSGLFATHPFVSQHYGFQQIDIYQKFKTGIEQGRLLTVSTSFDPSSGVVGIAGKHAYTVLGVKQEKIRVETESGSKVITGLFVKLRNPWGNMEGFMGSARSICTGGISRKYEKHSTDLNIQVTKSNKASFLIELNDFCEHFSFYDMSLSANRIFAPEKEIETHLAKINTYINQFKFDSSDIHELFNARTQYEKNLEKLLRIEELHTSNNPERNSALLELQVLKSENKHNRIQESKLLDIIRGHSSLPEIWNGMEEVDNTLRTTMSMQINAYNDRWSYLQMLPKEVKKCLKDLANLLNQKMHNENNFLQILEREASIKKLIIMFSELKALHTQFVELEMLGNKFGESSNTSTDLKYIADKIQQNQMLIEELVAKYNILDTCRDLLKQIDIMVEQVKTNRETTGKPYQELVNTYKEGNFNLSMRLLDTESKDEMELKEKMQEAQTLRESILQFFEKIRSMISRMVSHVSTLFHMNNSYELPAIEKAEVKTARLN